MDTTASSRAAAASVLAGHKPTATAQEKTSNSSTSMRRTIKSNAAGPRHPTKKLMPLEAPAAKQQSVTSNTSSGNSAVLAKSSRSAVQTFLGNKATTVLELDIASQLYAWIYMRHTLAESSNFAAAEYKVFNSTPCLS